MRKPKNCCKCDQLAVSGQAYCRVHHAESMREWRRSGGSRKEWKRGIDDAAEVLLRFGMTDAAELVRQQLAA